VTQCYTSESERNELPCMDTKSSADASAGFEVSANDLFTQSRRKLGPSSELVPSGTVQRVQIQIGFILAENLFQSSHQMPFDVYTIAPRTTSSWPSVPKVRGRCLHGNQTLMTCSSNREKVIKVLSKYRQSINEYCD
jgi:hypothetical protein